MEHVDPSHDLGVVHNPRQYANRESRAASSRQVNGKGGNTMRTNTKNRRFTVVIPTRERCDTLEHALRTCVIQDYDNLEILVSDNFSRDRTREIVESYKDPRIRYINPGKRLSMTAHYEFALSHVSPEGFVMYIGDDDGLLPNAIRDINAVVDRTKTPVLHWNSPSYWWPTADAKKANLLFIHSLGSGVATRDSATTIKNILSFKERFPVLPMMYIHSAIDFEVIKKIKALSGNFYHSLAPDVYSGFAVAGSIDQYVHSKRPYAIAGISSHSTGAGLFDSTSSKAGKAFLSEDNLPFHSSMVFTGSIEACVMECFLQARDHLPFFRNFTLSWPRLLVKMMEEAARKPRKIYMNIKDGVVQLGQMHNMPDAAQKAIAANPWINSRGYRKAAIGNLGREGFRLTRLLINHLCNGAVYLNCSSLNVKNIYDASILCDNILRLKEMRIIGYSTVVKASLSTIRRKLFHAA
ncbi:MAG: glycosyltransferase family 2 protein [Pirellulales bacterium]|nr:glycosyltransferase family 2 protein [Pirellulales bacterium]